MQSLRVPVGCERLGGGFERDILNIVLEILENRLITCRTDVLSAIEERKVSFRQVKKEAAI